MVTSWLLLSSLVASAFAHGHHAEPSDIALFRRNNLNERHEIQRRCAGTLENIHKRRLARRGHQGPEARGEQIPRAALCSMTAETTEGPYYVNNELFRTNVTDGQAGVPLKLHVTFLDVSNCEIAPNVYMEIWAANSTGAYSGFSSSGSGGGGGGAPGNGTSGGPPGGASGTVSGSGSMTIPGGGDATGAPQQTNSGSSTTTISSPFEGADSASGGGMGGGSTASDNFTFMRGVSKADEKGEATMWTNVPGWYQGRTVHIHIRVFENSTVADNGTFISHSGTLHHTGQLFFEQDLIESVAKLEPYASNALSYANATTNDQDGIYPYSTYGGYNPNLETSLLGDTLEDGLLGEIIITINSTYVSPMASTAYHVADDDADSGSASGTTSGSAAGSTSPSNSSGRRRNLFSLRRFFL
ncbi:aromatic compound dioxygenase [Auriculariales sp. MPI-PUGE-AT-0066]|nr:aromatic compound dioxygenase [Auriculariales sp. MPI-PUGE-AT-0066]